MRSCGLVRLIWSLPPALCRRARMHSEYEHVYANMTVPGRGLFNINTYKDVR